MVTLGLLVRVGSGFALTLLWTPIESEMHERTMQAGIDKGCHVLFLTGVQHTLADCGLH